MSEQLSEVYRNAIDLNRYSNQLAGRIIRAYNDVLLDAVDDLRRVDELAAPVKAARLRALIAQLTESLNSWAGDSTALITADLQELAQIQAEFATTQLGKGLSPAVASTVNTVEISGGLAQAVVRSEPTMTGVVNLSDNLEALARSPVAFQLTLGQELSLPNGEIVADALRNIGTKQAEVFSNTVRTGILQGESIPAIVRKVKGRLNRSQRGSISSIIAAGGQSTAIPNNQIRAIVRTSINQVSNAANQIVAAENPDITRKYQYRAVLDTRTSAICRALDGKIFTQGRGPEPPQHFNCRSIHVNIPRSLESEYRNLRDDYGQWLEDQSEATKIQVLGPGRLPYWNALVRKYGPSDAIRKFVSQDGTELSLDQLKMRYSSIIRTN